MDIDSETALSSPNVLKIPHPGAEQCSPMLCALLLSFQLEHFPGVSGHQCCANDWPGGG